MFALPLPAVLRTLCMVALLLALIAAPTHPARAEVLIGQTTSLSGAVAASVAETQLGARLYLDHVNAQGGVHGAPIRLLTLDDGFEPARAAQNARQLLDNPAVVALFLNRATPHTEAILPLLAQHRVALIAPSTGAMLLHEPVQPYVFNVRSTYQAEAERAVLHLHTLRLARIGVVHVDDSFGRDGLAGALKGFRQTGLEPAVQVAVDRTAPDHARTVAQLQQAQVQAVLWIGSSTAVSGGVRALREAGSAAQVLTLSNNASAGFVRQLGPWARGIIVTQVFPSERALGFALVRELHALARAAQVSTLSPAVIEGFAASKVLVAALLRAGPQPSRERMLEALNGLQRLDLGGLELGYSPQDHTGLNFVELSIIGIDGQFRR